MGSSAGLKELRIRGDTLFCIWELLSQVPRNDLRSIQLDLLDGITCTRPGCAALQELQANVGNLPPSLKRLSLKWVQPKRSTAIPPAAVAQEFLERCDELGAVLGDMGIEFRDNRFEASNGHKWSLSDYAWALPAIE